MVHFYIRIYHWEISQWDIFHYAIRCDFLICFLKFNSV